MVLGSMLFMATCSMRGRRETSLCRVPWLRKHRTSPRSFVEDTDSARLSPRCGILEVKFTDSAGTTRECRRNRCLSLFDYGLKDGHPVVGTPTLLPRSQVIWESRPAWTSDPPRRHQCEPMSVGCSRWNGCSSAPTSDTWLRRRWTRRAHATTTWWSTSQPIPNRRARCGGGPSSEALRIPWRYPRTRGADRPAGTADLRLVP